MTNQNAREVAVVHEAPPALVLSIEEVRQLKIFQIKSGHEGKKPSYSYGCSRREHCGDPVV
jgi:hypothetical protein